MTEDEWLRCYDATPMLEFLFTHPCYSERKMRLFAVACYWQVTEFLWDEPLFEDEINAIEQYADGLIGLDELRAISLLHMRDEFPNEEESALRFVTLEADYAVWIADWAVERSLFASEGAWPAGVASARQAGLLRDLFGNPFRQLKDDARWQSAAIDSVAKSIYLEMAFDRMPELANLIEVSGCPNSELIAHCREPGEHVRGCWALDTLIRKS